MINKKFFKILDDAMDNKKLFKLTLHTLQLNSAVGVISEYEASPDLENTIISIHSTPGAFPEQIIYGSDINVDLKIIVELQRDINQWEQLSRNSFILDSIEQYREVDRDKTVLRFFISRESLQKEVKMNDIKLPAVMEVENSIGVWIKRIVLRINPNGSCIVVYGNPVENFEKHNIAPDSLAYFQECREIKEPTWRAYTLNEDITSLLGQTLRSKRHENILKICTGVDIESNEISMDDSSLNMEDAFKELEFCNEDNEWQPVGVLEA